MTTKNLPTLVWVAFVAICLVWGTTYLGIKIAIKYFPPFWFSGIRHVAAGAIFLIFCLIRGDRFPTWNETLRLFIVGCFMVIGGNGLLSWAEIYISSGLAGILSSMAPLYITFLSIFFFQGFRVTWVILGGLVLSIIGIILLSKPDESVSVTDGFGLGIGLTFIANLSWALGSIFMKKYPTQVHVFMRTGVMMVTAGLVNLVFGTLFEPAVNYAAVPAEGWWTVLYLITVGSIVGYMCFVYLLDYMTPARLSIHVYVNTVVAVLAGWLLAGEHLTWLMLGAMVVILAGVIIVNNEYSKMAQKGLKV